MCRLLGFKIQSGNCRKELMELIDALKNSARNDPYLANLAKISRKTGHPDGWGYVIILDNGAVIEYHSIKPIYKDIQGYSRLLEIISNTEDAVGLIHVRRAGRELKGLLHTHPYRFYTKDHLDAWLIHNGEINKEFLKNSLGIDDEIERTDTYLLVKYLSRSRSDKLGETYIDLMRKNVAQKGSNILVLVINNDGDRKLLTCCFYKDEYRDYYRLFIYNKKYFTAVYSSTIIKYYPVIGDEISNRTCLWL